MIWRVRALYNHAILIQNAPLVLPCREKNEICLSFQRKNDLPCEDHCRNNEVFKLGQVTCVPKEVSHVLKYLGMYIFVAFIKMETTYPKYIAQ